MHTYEDEVGKRWGDTEAYRQSQAKTSKYSKDDFEAAKVDQEAATELFVYAFGNGYSLTRRSGSGMPTERNNSTTRAFIVEAEPGSCSFTASST